MMHKMTDGFCTYQRLLYILRTLRKLRTLRGWRLVSPVTYLALYIYCVEERTADPRQRPERTLCIQR